ncbi:Bifunctional polynucleotide phosphatase/kinase [Hypsibius exemplaris]|uniref:Bifunctional polynucleotide phosphatase/kinase n=1 Tax=Hypsibius exemplaris TaxID=2072580 RepID=A0A9X6NCK7_HYPEX|nr:Bifunctional polynucleotide phosphatase/kinase [Hypsibius exemplaris]
MPPKRKFAAMKRDDSPKRRATPDDNEDAPNSSKAKKAQKTSGWIDVNADLHVYNPDGLNGRKKIASFDLDGTIITTKSGKVFAKDAGDWQFLYPDVPGKLKSLHQEGVKVVIFTNQAGMKKGKTHIGEWRQKVDAILGKLAVPVQVLVASGEGINRKPAPGMWNHFVENYNEGVQVDMTESFYVGDAAGRPAAGPKGKKDFSCSDRLFASNVGLPFKTPEEFFLNRKPENFQISAFDPKKYLADAKMGKLNLLTPATTNLAFASQELIILVGPPGIGKSHFAKEHLISKNYIHVNRDTMKTWQKCVDAAEKSLSDGKSVVVDNTNGDLESRKRYLDVAKQRKVPCRCFVFTSSMEHAMHNNKFRELIDPHHEHVPEMVFRMWKGKFVMPSIGEGFTEVVEIKFIPTFSDPKREELYSMYLCEK